MKRFLLWTVPLGLAFPCFAALRPYAQTLDEADAIAIITVTSCEQSYHDGSIYESATLTVDTAIKGIKLGEKIKKSFGVPYQPAKYVNGRYVAKREVHSEGFSFQIAERHLVLLERKKGKWVLTRQSLILDDLVGDTYFEGFAGSQDVPVSKAIELLRAYKKAQRQRP